MFSVQVNILLSEKLLRPRPDRAMPQPNRNRQKRGNEVEKAAHVPDTAINRLQMSRRMRRPYLEARVRSVRSDHITLYDLNKLEFLKNTPDEACFDIFFIYLKDE